MKLRSVFDEGEEIPRNYTCDGPDISPPLEIFDVPKEAKSLALIVEDPDASSKAVWVHWVVWNIPPSTSRIHEGSLPKGAVRGMSDFRKNRYGGPCPPSGKHRYFFKLYALDSVLTLGSKSTKADLMMKMHKSIIATANLMGTYERKEED